MSNQGGGIRSLVTLAVNAYEKAVKAQARADSANADLKAMTRQLNATEMEAYQREIDALDKASA